jgi:hypothetical protein
MNSPFVLEDKNNKIFSVSWPTMDDVRQLDTKIKLLNILFKTLKMNEIGLIIKFHVDEVNVLWIKEMAYYGYGEQYDLYLHDHYDIIGVAFNTLSDAEKFKDYLEKKLVWKILSV